MGKEEDERSDYNNEYVSRGFRLCSNYFFSNEIKTNGRLIKGGEIQCSKNTFRDTLLDVLYVLLGSTYIILGTPQ